MEPKHASYGPSSMARIVNCAASHKACSRFRPGESGVEAMEGHAAHALAEHCINNNERAEQHRGRMLVVTPDEGGDPRQFEVDKKMIYDVQIMIDFCQSIKRTPGTTNVEARVSLKHLDPDCWGTLDFGHAGDDRVLTIVDYKNGYLDVEVVDNYQSYTYAVGALHTPEVCPNPDAIDWVRLVIVQPNSIAPGPRVKQIVVPVETVRNFETALAFAIAQSKRDDAAFKIGPWCTYCPAMGICPATVDRLNIIGTLLTMDLSVATPEQLSLLFRTKKMVEQIFKKANTKITQQMLAGNDFPNMKLVTSVKWKQWVNEEATTQKLYDTLGMAGLRPKTPAQVAKLGKDGVALSDTLSSTPPGEATPADASDKRQPFTTRSVTEIFGK